MGIKQLRMAQTGLLVSTVAFAAIAESVSEVGRSDWTWRQWLVAGLALWSILGGYRFRQLSRRRSEQALSDGDRDGKAFRKWNAAQLASLMTAESVGLYGVFIRLGLHGARWQAVPFYLVALFFLLLWTPRPLVKEGSAPV